MPAKLWKIPGHHLADGYCARGTHSILMPHQLWKFQDASQPLMPLKLRQIPGHRLADGYCARGTLSTLKPPHLRQIPGRAQCRLLGRSTTVNPDEPLKLWKIPGPSSTCRLLGTAHFNPDATSITANPRTRLDVGYLTRGPRQPRCHSRYGKFRDPSSTWRLLGKLTVNPDATSTTANPRCCARPQAGFVAAATRNAAVKLATLLLPPWVVNPDAAGYRAEFPGPARRSDSAFSGR